LVPDFTEYKLTGLTLISVVDLETTVKDSYHDLTIEKCIQIIPAIEDPQLQPVTETT